MVWRNRPFLNGFFRRTQSLGIFGMTVLSLGCLGTTDGSKSDEAVGPQWRATDGARRQARSALYGGDADSAPGQPALGGQPEMGGELPIDIRPVSAVPGKPILDLNEACQGLTDQWDVGHTKFEDEVLMLTNEARSEARRCGQYGMFPAVPPVFPNELLRCAARLHSLDMVERGYFDHADPEGVGPDVRTTDTGYPWVAVGENIAAGSNTPRKVVDGWIDSPRSLQKHHES